MTSGGDRVSWLLIEPGWRVTSVEGDHVGHVVSVDGEGARDIFDGLEIRHHVLGRVVYVASEEVAEIVEGDVRLTIAAAEVERRSSR